MVRQLNFIVFFLISTLDPWSDAVCPRRYLLDPCTCATHDFGDLIWCEQKRSDNSFNLKRTFKRISDSHDADSRHFHKLVIESRHIEEIESNLLANLTFDQLSIFETHNLRRIHSSAFESTAEKLKDFMIFRAPKYSSYPAPYNLYDMLNSFANIVTIDISTANITHVPSEAIGPLPSLHRLEIRSSNNLSIADRAFYNINSSNLYKLELFGNPIDYLPSEAIRLREDSSSNQTIKLWLISNTLNSTSFSSGWLNNINRPVEAYLSANKITYLDQNVFEPFLNDTRNGLLHLDSNPFNCSDCRNAWLKRGDYQQRVYRPYCNGNLNQPSVFDTNFDHCP